MRALGLILVLALAACGEAQQGVAVRQCLKVAGGEVAIPGGVMMMGARGQMPGEGPPRRVSVKPFRMDRTDVTNGEFAAFVAATGYVTRAERGRDLPTEAEWEFAARGGIEGAIYVWGDERPGKGQAKANTWQGAFPLQDTGDDGFRAAPAPVGCFPANGYGLYDMAGNVWQWTSDEWRGDLTSAPEAAPDVASYDPADPYATQRVIKGGSFLCADNYCLRYRPAARTAASAGDGASHIGFRTVLREEP